MSGIFFLFDGRQLDEAGQAALTGNADGHSVAAEGVARQELGQRLAGQLIGVGVGLAEDFRMFDVIEGGGRDGAVDDFEANGLEGALTEIDAPDAGRRRLAEAENEEAGLRGDAGFGLGLLLGLGGRLGLDGGFGRPLGGLAAGLTRFSTVGLAGLPGDALAFGSTGPESTSSGAASSS